jgi:PAS domain S-box-containing protein
VREQALRRERVGWSVASPRVAPSARDALSALLVGVGYYVGAKVGFAFTFQPHQVSTLWPPNAIMMAALMLAPVRIWWLIVLAAFPAHLASQLQSGVPIPMLLSWFASNTTEALIGAICVRRFAGTPVRFDTVRHIVLFIVFAVFLAPFLSTFLDAALVRLNGFGSDDFWQISRIRFFSNTLAALTLVPVIVTWGNGGITSGLRAPLWRYLEAGLLMIALVTVGFFVFNAFNAKDAGPGTIPALVCAPVPFLLWAAARYGPAGVSTFILVVASLTIWGAVHGLGPFVSLSPSETALDVQLFLVVVSVPHLFLAAAMTERWRAEYALRESEERYRAVVDAQAELICRYLPDATLTFVNDAYCRYFGKTREEILGTKFLELVPERERESSLMYVEALLSGQEPAMYEHQVTMADGSVRWQQWVDLVIQDSSGNAAELQGIGRDITERRQAEEALRRKSDYVALLQDVAVAANEAATTSQALQTCVEKVCETSGWEVGHVYAADGAPPHVLNPTAIWCVSDPSAFAQFVEATAALSFEPGQGLPGRVFANQRPEWVVDLQADERFTRSRVAMETGIRSAFAFPVLVGTEVAAVLEFFATTETEPEAELRDLVVNIGTQLGRVVERVRAEQALRESREALRSSHDRIQDLAGSLITAQEEERRRVSRELHDDFNQKLAALSIGLSNLKRHVPVDRDALVERLDSLQRRTVELTDDVRRLTHRLHPAALEHAGLPTALKAYCSEFAELTGIGVDLSVGPESAGLPTEVALCLYRVAQEALRNTATHSGARNVTVRLDSTERAVCLTISDEGTGFDPERSRLQGGLGLVSMEERVRLLNGSFRVQSAPGRGTELRIEIPLGREAS